ncbi:MAG: hypothetical protein IJS67_01480 [Clostridia bacterium]|nr:hypothetical protein [Clostridia bacterium]
MHINKKVILLIIISIVSLFAFSGCYELGDGTEDDEDYRATYPEIILIDQNADSHYYSMEDFYNDEAVNDLKSPLSEDERSEYSYILIKSEKDLSLGEIAVYFDSTVEATVSVSVFILDGSDIPTKVYTGDGGKYSESESNEPDSAAKLTSVVFHVTGIPGKWKEFYLKDWSNDLSRVKRHDIKRGQYLVFRIDNNCYDPAKTMLDKAAETYQALVDAFNQKAAELQTVNNDPSATAEQKDAALQAYNTAAREKNSGELIFNAAQKQYEEEKTPYSTKAPLRITAILINAE